MRTKRFIAASVACLFQTDPEKVMEKSWIGLFYELQLYLIDSQCVGEHPDRKMARRYCFKDDATVVPE